MERTNAPWASRTWDPVPTRTSFLDLRKHHTVRPKKNVITHFNVSRRTEKKCEHGIRTHAAQKEGCAERIAPIGTLSQNGYGEDHGTHKRTMGKPDVADIDWSRMLGFKLASFPQKKGHVEQTIIFSNQKRATIFQTPSGKHRFAQISRGLTRRKSSQGSTGTRVKFSHRPRVHYADRKQKSRRSDRNSSIS